MKPVQLTVRVDAGCDFADLFEVKDALAKKGKYVNRVEKGRLRAGLRARQVRPLHVDLGQRTGAARQGRPDLQGEDRAARRVDDRSGCRDGDDGLRGAARAAEVRAGARPAEHATGPGTVAGERAEDRMRLGSTQGDVPTEPRRSGCPALQPARRRDTKPARGRPALVHDDVRPRQHPHQPAGAPVHTRARRRRLCSRSAAGKARGSTTSATRIRAGSSTRCATAS